MFKVAIVGRPNVGKSTLFNRLSRTRKALVGDEPGMTRDRIYQLVEWEGRPFELIDTGGILPDVKDTIPGKIYEQAEVAIEQADLILLMVDVRAQLNPVDKALYSLIRARGKECLVVVNKVDVSVLEEHALQFYEMGCSALFPISAEHKLGTDELLDEIARRIPATERPLQESEIRVAIVGRPNVGKSSLLNRVIGEERVIVSEIPGTTRDAVDTCFRFQGQQFRLVDTAGIRRKGKTELMAEKLSVVMARKNIEEADVVLLTLDAAEGATSLDATIGGYAHEAGKSLVILVNKWDLVEKDSFTAIRVEKEFREKMKFLDYAPMLFVSALSGQRVFKALGEAQKVYQARFQRIATPELNDFLQRELGPALQRGAGTRRPPLKFACQVGVAPPTFVLFLRGSSKLHFSTVRFVINRLREKEGFYGTPLRILQRTGGKERRRAKS